jgi:clan AA aspartic protease (TIGR02281 family)
MARDDLMNLVRAAALAGCAMALSGCLPTTDRAAANAPPPPATAAAAAAPAGAPVEIDVPLEADHGTFLVPVLINNTLAVKATLDSGASDVVIPAAVAEELARGGTIADSDYIGDRTYELADGSTVPSKVFNIRSLKVGALELTNVRAALGGRGSSLLLGQSFLSRLEHWSIDNRRHVLVLTDSPDAQSHIGPAPVREADAGGPAAPPRGPASAGAGIKGDSDDSDSDEAPTRTRSGKDAGAGDDGKKHFDDGN